MAKILNLDKLAGNTRELVIGGVAHKIGEMTVDNFIATSRAAAALGDNPSNVEQLAATIDMLIRTVPTLTREVLIGLPLTTLAKVTEFVRGDDNVEGAEEVAVEGAEGK